MSQGGRLVLSGIYFYFCLLSLPTFGAAPISIFALGEEEAIRKAKENSEKLKGFSANVLAAQEQADAAHSDLLPRLDLTGSYRYLTVVPSIQFPTTGGRTLSMPIGANSNYTIGPTLSYTLWDSGAKCNARNSLLKQVSSREEDQKNATAQLVGSVKAAYAQVQLGLDQLSLLKESLELATAQDREITRRYQAGTASKLDLLTANRDVLNYQLQLKQQQANLSGNLRDLLTLLNDRSDQNDQTDQNDQNAPNMASTMASTHSENISENISENFPQDISRPAPVGYPDATIWLKFDPLVSTIAKEAQSIPAILGKSPIIKSQEFLLESMELASKSQLAQAYPQIQLSARTSIDYPNGPTLETINQNTFGASFTMPLFEFNRTRHLAAGKIQDTERLRHQKNQLESDLRRDFNKAKDLLDSLRRQEKDEEESVKQAETLKTLNYQSYLDGRITLVDVQAANVRALQAKFELARIRSQILNQMILLKTLAGQEG